MPWQVLLFQVGLRGNRKDIVPGAQTERRGGAGPVGGLLGGKDPTGRFSTTKITKGTNEEVRLLVSASCFSSLIHLFHR
jgi:hypothetical protein